MWYYYNKALYQPFQKILVLLGDWRAMTYHSTTDWPAQKKVTVICILIFSYNYYIKGKSGGNGIIVASIWQRSDRFPATAMNKKQDLFVCLCRPRDGISNEKQIARHAQRCAKRDPWECLINILLPNKWRGEYHFSICDETAPLLGTNSSSFLPVSPKLLTSLLSRKFMVFLWKHQITSKSCISWKYIS